MVEKSNSTTCGIITGSGILVSCIIFIIIINVWSMVELANHWDEFGNNCPTMRNMMLAYIIITFFSSCTYKNKNNKQLTISILIIYGLFTIFLGIYYQGNYNNQQCFDFIITTNIYWLSLSTFIICCLFTFLAIIATIILFYFD